MRKYTILFGMLGALLVYNDSYAKVRKTSSRLFSTLTIAQDYSAKRPEYPDIDNIDWAHPDYSSFLRTLVPGYFDCFLERIGIRKSLWTAEAFYLLIKMITKDRELNGYIGRFVQKIDPVPGSQFVIFGDFHGALHSFIRDLAFLELKGIIDKNLTICKPYCYLVFNGNVVGQSPYSLETLTIIMQLMHRNPERVFYIRGLHEDKEEWHNYSLKDELSIYARHLERKFDMVWEKIPLNKLINRFFNTLPLALYLGSAREEKKIDVVRISHYGINYSEINEKKFAGFLNLPGSSNPQTFKLTNKLTSSKKVSVNTLITREKLDISYKKTPGLRSLGREKGIITWAVLSSPIDSHRRLYEFFYDAFAILTIYPKIDDWTIALYNQDVRTKSGFEKTKVYNLTSGMDISGKEITLPVPEREGVRALRQELQAAREQIKELKEEITETAEVLKKIKVSKKPIPKIEDKKPVKKEKETPTLLPEQEVIKFGSTVDLSRSVRLIGRQTKEGLELKFSAQNKLGGVNGKRLDLIVLDDGYMPKNARENIEKLLSENIDLIISPVGSSTLESYIDLVKNKRIVVLFPIASQAEFHKKELTNIINFRASGCDESMALVKYMLDKTSARNFALFYQDDMFGLSCLAGARTVLKEAGIKEWLELPYSRSRVNFEKQAEIIKKENIDAIGLLATATASISLLRQTGISHIFNKKLFGTYALSVPLFKKFLEQERLSAIISHLVPNPKLSDLEIVREFRSLADKAGIEKGEVALEAFIDASIVIDISEKMEGPITKESIIKSAEALKDYDFKGLHLNFDPQTRQLYHIVWLDTGKPEWEAITIGPSAKEEKIKEIKKGECEQEKQYSQETTMRLEWAA